MQETGNQRNKKIRNRKKQKQKIENGKTGK